MICVINFKKSKKLISHHENFKRKFFVGLIKIPFFLVPHVLELSYMEKKTFLVPSMTLSLGEGILCIENFHAYKLKKFTKNSENVTSIISILFHRCIQF
jgi:uncharacterized membrane protein